MMHATRHRRGAPTRPPPGSKEFSVRRMPPSSAPVRTHRERHGLLRTVLPEKLDGVIESPRFYKYNFDRCSSPQPLKRAPQSTRILSTATSLHMPAVSVVAACRKVQKRAETRAQEPVESPVGAWFGRLLIRPPVDSPTEMPQRRSVALGHRSSGSGRGGRKRVPMLPCKPKTWCCRVACAQLQ